MQRLAVIARLKPHMSVKAAELIAAGPPFDPADIGLERHSVYLSSAEAVFVFEGQEVEWIVDGLVDDPFRSPVFAAWAELIDGSPHPARETYFWTREQAETA